MRFTFILHRTITTDLPPVGLAIAVLAIAALICIPNIAVGQSLEIRTGDPVPRDVREMYDAGLDFLARTQDSRGGWPSGQQGAGVAGMAVMCFMASGEDPNYGIYAGNIRRSIRYIITIQDKSTGYFGGSMYHHGFAMLGLAEAYGAVDDRNLWPSGNSAEQISIGQSLELAVRSAITSQKQNPTGSWRYRPSAIDADTSVAGAVLMGLLAARNAGIEVPDESIDKAIAYFVRMTAPSGQVAYTGGIGASMQAAVELDTQTCRVGDPLSLALTISGDINIENLSPPRLSKTSGCVVV